jgi:hypothetical protein
MNKSILIVICDFLLVSLLAFSTVDINRVTQGGTPQLSGQQEIVTNQPEKVDTGKDLAAVMNLALNDERKKQEQLQADLAKARQASGENEQQAKSLQQALQAKQQEATLLEQQRTGLQQQYTSAQTNIQNLNQQIENSSAEVVLSHERLATMEADLRKQAMEAAALQQQLAQLARSNQTALTEKQRLSTQLQVAEVEKRSAAEQAARMQEEVKVEREEKAKLADDVKTLANKSGQLAQEIHENRPLAANMIFNEFLTNRVKAQFHASRAGALGLGTANRDKDTETVLAMDGTNIFALCHVQDTPLAFSNPGTEWTGLIGTLTHGGEKFPIRSLSFSWPDPRVIMIPVTAEEAHALGSKIYHLTADPYKFQDAVLIGAKEGYYGECRFQIELGTPDYVKLDNSFLKGLFGKFNPSRGDLVFSKTGELLGVMANNSYCTMIHGFDTVGTVQFGPDVRAQHTGETLSRLYSTVFEMPSKLQ